MSSRLRVLVGSVITISLVTGWTYGVARWVEQHPEGETPNKYDLILIRNDIDALRGDVTALQRDVAQLSSQSDDTIRAVSALQAAAPREIERPHHSDDPFLRADLEKLQHRLNDLEFQLTMSKTHER